MKLAKRLKKEGYSKQEIFERACDNEMKKKEKKKVASYLATYPDADDAARYNTANRILIGIYTLLFIINLLGIATMGQLPPAALLLGLILPALIIYSLYQKLVFGYIFLCVVLLQSIASTFANYESPPMIAVQVIAFSGLIVFSLTLKSKLYPFQGAFNHRKKDENGLPIFTKPLADDGYK